LYTDIDFFKKVNDTYGHDFGDAVLKRYAAVIEESMRKYDLFCRYGGEEFLMMIECDKTDIAGALAQRIMERLKSERFDVYPDFRFTISVGIAAGVPSSEDTLDTYIKNADAALYESKNSGRNTIRIYQNCVV
jgi:diguanylate cyclase (GGDEF)-like protein